MSMEVVVGVAVIAIPVIVFLVLKKKKGSKVSHSSGAAGGGRPVGDGSLKQK